MIIDLDRLKDFLAEKNHTHSDYLTSHQSLNNYYTKSEIDALIGDAIEIINGSGNE